MFITLTQLRNEEASVLQTAIDNTGGKLHVALRGFHYEVGYRNVGSSQGFFLRSPNPQNPNSPVQQSFPVPPGLYTFKQLSRFIAENVNGAQLSLTATNITRLIVPRHIAIKFRSDLRRLLGIDEKGWIEGTYEGDRPARIVAHKWFHIYLDQLSTSSNLIDGAPSTLLAIVPAAAVSSTADITPSNPMYKKLEVGDIHHLNLRVLDEDGAMVQHREKYMPAVLEIRENVYAANVCNFD